MHNTQIHHLALNFIRTCIILYFATLSAISDVIFLILLSKNQIFTVPNVYPHVSIKVTHKKRACIYTVYLVHTFLNLVIEISSKFLFLSINLKKGIRV